MNISRDLDRVAATISSMLLAPLVLAGLLGAPQPAAAAPDDNGDESSESAPADPSPEQPATESQPDAVPPPSIEPPPPSITPPSLDPEQPGPAEPEPGIEFAVPPPETDPDEPAEIGGAPPVFPDPGMAPDNGGSMLVLSGTTIGLTIAGFSTGLVVGLRNQVPLSWLLPSTIVPTVGLLAFAGGGLYLGIKRRMNYRRWEAGNRVIGTPQGGGLRIGASFSLLAALSFVPAGVFALDRGETALGATMIGVGSAAAIATPIMFVVAARQKREYQRTGGWRRRPIPPAPAGPVGARIELAPTLTPVPGGVSLGLVGRF